MNATLPPASPEGRPRPRGLRLLGTILLVTGVAALVLLAYWAGQRHGQSPVEESRKSPASGERRILYYRNPMGLPDTSPTPKKDPMGMDYLPVFADEGTVGAPVDSLPGEIRISPARVQKLGVRSEGVTRGRLVGTVHALGRVEADEARTVSVTPRFEGYVEALRVNTTGQGVAPGQVLMEVYSPELVATQREYLIARAGQGSTEAPGADEDRRRVNGDMGRLAEAALMRLRNLGMDAADLDTLVRQGEVRRTLRLRAPTGGIVSEKRVLPGQRFAAGDTLYQITDLSRVWIVADVYEQDIAALRPGLPAEVRVPAVGPGSLTGRVTYIYPTANRESRTVPVRVELSNPGGALRPGMYGEVDLHPPVGEARLLVPVAAVLESGRRSTVFLDLGEGRYAPREVRLGSRSGEQVEVLAGLNEGDRVVTAANFLLDADSNLKSALQSFTPPPQAAQAPQEIDETVAGVVEALDLPNRTLTLHHQPVLSLKWPAMTMDFTVARPELLQGLKPGQALRFRFAQGQAGEWIITRILPPGEPAASSAASPAASPAVPPHAGH